MTCYEKVNCSDCGSDSIKKAGKSSNGTQRYRCVNPACETRTFMLKYRYRAYEAGVKQQAIDMVINSSGIRDAARVLKINKGTVMSALKKRKNTHSSESSILYSENAVKPRAVRLAMVCEEAELDEPVVICQQKI